MSEQDVVRAVEAELDDADQCLDTAIRPNQIAVWGVRQALEPFGGKPHRFPPPTEWSDYKGQRTVNDRALAALNEIALHHQKRIDESGGTWGECCECDYPWPCPTYVWATDLSRDPLLAPWDPADDEDPDPADRGTGEPDCCCGQTSARLVFCPIHEEES